MASSYRPLLPKPTEGPVVRDATSAASASAATTSSRIRASARAHNRIRKAPHTPNACDRCRRRKVKCNGGRPACSACSKSGVDCAYSLRKTPVTSEKDRNTLHLLRTLPRAEALVLLQSLRKDSARATVTTSPTTSLDRWAPPVSPLLSALSDHTWLKDQLVPTQNELEFELMARHPVPYPPLFPLQIASLPWQTLLRPSRVSPLSKSPDRSFSDHKLTHANIRHLPERPLVDERLQELEMKNWSRVAISNELAGKILSLYIEIDYPILPLFDLDLFLQDLLNNRQFYCSRFLVNCLFSWACQAYTAIRPEAHLLGRAFFQEAEHLIVEQENEECTLTAVAAFTILCIAAMGNSQDSLALHFLRHGIRIGTRLGLFGVGHEGARATTWLDGDEDWNSATSHTAWGVYNWVSLYYLRYHSLEIDTPPNIPMPSIPTPIDLAIEELDLSARLVNKHVFRASCKLWVIFHDVARRRDYNDGYDNRWHNLEFAEEIFHRLIAWADALPLCLVRSDQSTHAVIMMHIYYHVIVVDIFRHHLHASRANSRLRSFTTLQSTPQAIYAASVNQLKRLLLISRLYFKDASLSILSQTVLIYVYNAVMQEIRNSDRSEWRFYLRLCLAAAEDLFGSYREAWSVTRGLLSMALRRGAMIPEEAKGIARELLELGRHYNSLSPGVDTRSLIDLDLATSNPNAARVGKISQRLEELMLERTVG